ncbi:MAG: hypothetical protein WKF96_07955, partial [Solirubrobacteraceae bacterium]
ARWGHFKPSRWGQAKPSLLRCGQVLHRGPRAVGQPFNGITRCAECERFQDEYPECHEGVHDYDPDESSKLAEAWTTKVRASLEEFLTRMVSTPMESNQFRQQAQRLGSQAMLEVVAEEAFLRGEHAVAKVLGSPLYRTLLGVVAPRDRSSSGGLEAVADAGGLAELLSVEDWLDLSYRWFDEFGPRTGAPDEQTRGEMSKALALTLLERVYMSPAGTDELDHVDDGGE